MLRTEGSFATCTKNTKKNQSEVKNVIKVAISTRWPHTSLCSKACKPCHRFTTSLAILEPFLSSTDVYLT